MSVTVIVTKTLDNIWADDIVLDTLSDQEIIDLVKEDIHEFFDGASIEVEREKNPV